MAMAWYPRHSFTTAITIHIRCHRYRCPLLYMSSPTSTVRLLVYVPHGRGNTGAETQCLSKRFQDVFAFGTSDKGVALGLVRKRKKPDPFQCAACQRQRAVFKRQQPMFVCLLIDSGAVFGKSPALPESNTTLSFGWCRKTCARRPRQLLALESTGRTRLSQSINRQFEGTQK